MLKRMGNRSRKSANFSLEKAYFKQALWNHFFLGGTRDCSTA